MVAVPLSLEDTTPVYIISPAPSRRWRRRPRVPIPPFHDPADKNALPKSISVLAQLDERWRAALEETGATLPAESQATLGVLLRHIVPKNVVGAVNGPIPNPLPPLNTHGIRYEVTRMEKGLAWEMNVLAQGLLGKQHADFWKVVGLAAHVHQLLRTAEKTPD